MTTSKTYRTKYTLRKAFEILETLIGCSKTLQDVKKYVDWMPKLVIDLDRREYLYRLADIKRQVIIKHFQLNLMIQLDPNNNFFI